MLNPVSSSLASGVLPSGDAGTEVSIAVLKKTNDVAKTEGEGLIQMLEDTMSQINEHLLDVYA